MSNISLLFGCSSPGLGLTSYLSQVAIELKKSGVNIEVLTDPAQQDKGLFEKLADADILVHKCPGLSKFSRPYSHTLHKIVANGRYNVIHLYGIQKTVKSWEFKHSQKRPIFITNLNSLLLSENWVASLRNIIAYRILLKKNCDSVVTVSNFLADTLSSRYCIPKEKINVIHNGMELDWFDLCSKQEPRPELKSEIVALQDNPIVCKVGFLYALKGYKYYLKAAKQVVDQKKNVQFLIVGKGPHLEYLQQYVQTLGLTENVHFLGQVKYEEIPWLLSKITIGVSTSLMEQYPKVLLEFASAGKPVIASDVGDSSQIIHDGVNGYIVPRLDSVSTGNHILELLENQKHAKAMGASGRRLVESEFTMPKMANNLKNHYLNVTR